MRRPSSALAGRKYHERRLPNAASTTGLSASLPLQPLHPLSATSHHFHTPLFPRIRPCVMLSLLGSCPPPCQINVGSTEATCPTGVRKVQVASAPSDAPFRTACAERDNSVPLRRSCGAGPSNSHRRAEATYAAVAVSTESTCPTLRSACAERDITRA